MSESVRPATDAEIARWQEVAGLVRNNHASEIPDRFITLAMYLSDLKSVLARIDAERAIREELLAALERLGSMEAFHVGTVHVPEEVKRRIDYARAAIAKAAQGREESK